SCRGQLRDRDRLAQERARGEEVLEVLAVVGAREPRLAALGVVQLRVVPPQRPDRVLPAALRAADQLVHRCFSSPGGSARASTQLFGTLRRSVPEFAKMTATTGSTNASSTHAQRTQPSVRNAATKAAARMLIEMR